MKKRNNFLEQIRRAREAAKTKPETGAPKPANEMTDSELRAGGVGSYVLRFFGFPDFITGHQRDT